MLCYPKMYKKRINDIDYDKLKNIGIKCLAFDLDNTIALIDQDIITKETELLLRSLKNDFIIVIISNNREKRVKKYADILECGYVCKAKKPFGYGFRKIKNRYNLKKCEIAIIGDQLITDILGANLFNAYPILVDPMAKKDLKITAFNRLLERKVFEKYKKRGIMEKGEYYD